MTAALPLHRPLWFPATLLAAVPLLLAVALAFNADFFERSFFFNELLCLIGLAVLMAQPRVARTDAVTWLVLAYLAYGLLRVAGAVFEPRLFPGSASEAAFITVQQSVLVYGALAYFAGRAVAPYAQRFWAAIWLPMLLLWLWIWFAVPTLYHAELHELGVRHHLPVSRFSAPVLIPLTVAGGAPLVAALLTMWGTVQFSISLDIATAAVIALALPVFAFAPRRLWWALVGLGVLAYGVLLLWALPWLPLAAGPHNLYDVVRAQPLLGRDHSITWRLVMAWQVLIEQFPTNLWGTGFGGPLLNVFPVDEHAPYPLRLPWTMSPHNAVFALLGRLGLIGVVLVLAIWFLLLQHYLRQRAAWRASRREPLAWSLLALLIIGLLNPMLDTPTLAGLHWFGIGLVAALRPDVRSAP